MLPPLSPVLGANALAVNTSSTAVRVLDQVLASASVPPAVVPALEGYLRFSAIILLAYVAGLIFQRIGLPKVSAYVCTGAMVGPDIFGLIVDSDLPLCRFLLNACLAMIGLGVGAELNFPELVQGWRQVSIVTIAITISTWICVFTAFPIAAYAVIVMHQVDTRHFMAMASLTATIMIARSPASCISVLSEMGARGPFSSLVLNVTMLKDALVITLFSINLEFCIASLAPGEALPTYKLVLLPLAYSAAALAFGAIGGSLMTLQLRFVTSQLPERVCALIQMVSIVAWAVSIFFTTEWFRLDGLLACVVASIVCASTALDARSGPLVSAEFAKSMRNVSPVNAVMFFTLAGASLPLGLFSQHLGSAIMVVVIRLAAIFCGTRIGGQLGECDAEHTRLLWLAMVTQGGVALGLIHRISDRLPELGESGARDFYALLVTVVCLNLAIGPPMFKQALLLSQECAISTKTLLTPKV